MTTSVAEYDDATVLTVTGYVDRRTAPALGNEIEAVLRDRPSALIIDLSAVVAMVMSAVIAELVQAHQSVVPATTIVVVAAPGTVRILRKVNLDQIFAYPTLDEALASVRPH
ncbi:STAS domain-containing protein [Nocardia sp. NPDC050408]|uniref:STAS domain-containing protein n=1 Tax=Nocardia sp. NPDC050408 TaxID=3364319 RepID=UPI0037A9DDC4